MFNETKGPTMELEDETLEAIHKLAGVVPTQPNPTLKNTTADPKIGRKVKVSFEARYAGLNALGEPCVRWEEGDGHHRSAYIPKNAQCEFMGFERGDIVKAQSMSHFRYKWLPETEFTVEFVGEPAFAVVSCANAKGEKVYDSCHPGYLTLVRSAK